MSVLDPPFDDDNDESHNPEDEGGFDYECSYAIVQSKCLMVLLSTYACTEFPKDLFCCCVG